MKGILWQEEAESLAYRIAFMEKEEQKIAIEDAEKRDARGVWKFYQVEDLETKLAVLNKYLKSNQTEELHSWSNRIDGCLARITMISEKIIYELSSSLDSLGEEDWEITDEPEMLAKIGEQFVRDMVAKIQEHESDTITIKE